MSSSLLIISFIFTFGAFVSKDYGFMIFYAGFAALDHILDYLTDGKVLD